MEHITNPRVRPGSLRIWADASRGELRAATCRLCGRLAPAVDLVRHHASHGGRALLCALCHAAQLASYDATPKRRAAQRARVTSGANAARKRRWREEHPGANAARTRATMRRRAARTPAEVEATRDRLRPGGVKRCRKCRGLLPFEAFSADATTPDGLRTTCRACSNLGLMTLALPHIESADVWSCTYCGAAIAHIDHVQPSSRGGLDIAENLIGSCQYCNTSKGARTPWEWKPDFMDLVATWPCIQRYI